MADPTMDALIEQVETDLLNEIIRYLETDRMTDEQASELAREFLALLPIEDKKELLEKLKAFSNAHVEAKGVYLKYAAPYDEEVRQKKLALMSEHIKNGQIENALQVAKGENNAGS